MLSIEEVDEIARRPNSLPISCSLSLNMDMLLARTWHMMGLVRVYTKKVWHSLRWWCHVVVLALACLFCVHAL